MDAFIELSDAELDMVAGGAASVKLDITKVEASGPTKADVALTNLVATATTVGGASPSNTAILGFNLDVESA